MNSINVLILMFFFGLTFYLALKNQDILKIILRYFKERILGE